MQATGRKASAPQPLGAIRPSCRRGRSFCRPSPPASRSWLPGSPQASAPGRAWPPRSDRRRPRSAGPPPAAQVPVRSAASPFEREAAGRAVLEGTSVARADRDGPVAVRVGRGAGAPGDCRSATPTGVTGADAGAVVAGHARALRACAVEAERKRAEQQRDERRGEAEPDRSKRSNRPVSRCRARCFRARRSECLSIGSDIGERSTFPGTPASA